MKTGIRKNLRFWIVLSICIPAFMVLLAYIFILTDKMTDLKRPQVKLPSPNAFDYYTKAGNLIKDKDVIDYFKPYKLPWYKNPKNPKDRYYTLAERKTVVGKNSNAIRTLREGFKYDYVTPTFDFNDLTLYRNLSSFREMARLLKLSSLYYDEIGNTKEALILRIDGMKLANDIPKNADMKSMLVAVACQAIVYTDIYNLLEKVDLQTTKNAIKRLDLICKDNTPVVDNLEVEKYENYRMLKEIFDIKNWRFDYQLVDNITSNPTKQSMLRLKWTTMSKRNVSNNLIEFYNHEKLQSKIPYIKYAKVTEPNDIICKFICSNELIHKELFKYTEGTRMRTMLLIALALRAYKLENGKYPDNLKQLVPKHIKTLPQDPYSVNADYKYKNSGNKFLLYSLGPDGKDNGGNSIKRLPGRTRTIVVMDSIGDIVWGVK